MSIWDRGVAHEVAVLAERAGDCATMSWTSLQPVILELGELLWRKSEILDTHLPKRPLFASI